MKMIAKMTLENVFAQAWGGAKVIFRCIYDQNLAEDVRFSKATPNGHIEMVVDNPAVASQLIIGKQYYVTFERVPDPAPAPDAVEAAGPVEG